MSHRARFIAYVTMLLLVIVVAPIGLAAYFDAFRAMDDARRTGEAAARLAPRILQTGLTVEAQGLSGSALRLAQQLTAGRLYDGQKLATKGDEVVKSLTAATPERGFAWIVDPEGVVVAAQGALSVTGRNLRGHPVVAATQEGLVVDSIWPSGESRYLIAAAPFVQAGEASGCVVLGRPMDLPLLKSLRDPLGAELTFVADDRVLISTLDPDTAELVLAAAGKAAEPVAGGRFKAPLAGSSLFPFLPVFIPENADGLAYTSVAIPYPGSPHSWIVSVPSNAALDEVAARQEYLLVALVSMLLVGVVFALVLHRQFVSPLGRVIDHLSDLTTGSGERELNELEVSASFQRLVRLINMATQRLPAMPTYSDEPAATAPLSTRRPARPSESPADGGPPSEDEFGAAPIQLAAPRASTLSRSIDLPQVPSSPPTPPPVTPPVGSTPTPIRAAVTPVPALATGDVPRSASEIRGIPSHALLREPAPAPTPPPARPSPPAPKDTTPPDPFAADPFAGLASEPFPRSASAGPRMGGSAMSFDKSVELAPSGFGVAGLSDGAPAGGFRSEATAVGAPSEDLIARTAREMTGNFEQGGDDADAEPGDRTVVAKVPKNLLEQAANDEFDDLGGDAGDDSRPDEVAHFRETYDAFLEMRKACGEPISDLAFDRFVAKLKKNRDGLIKKYNCRTVRFQVYEKNGKAALKATPIRA